MTWTRKQNKKSCKRSYRTHYKKGAWKCIEHWKVKKTLNYNAGKNRRSWDNFEQNSEKVDYTGWLFKKISRFWSFY